MSGLKPPPVNAVQPEVDQISRQFGATTPPRRPEFDLSFGALRDCSALTELWSDLDQSDPIIALMDYPTTQGPERLRIAFAHLMETEGSDLQDPDTFVATHGALDAIGHALRSINPDRILFPSPGFDIAIAASRTSGTCEPVRWGPDGSIQELLDALRIALKSGDPDKTAVVVNFPANPSGATPTETEWTALVQLTAEMNAYLIVDDVYRFSGPPAQRPSTGGNHVVVVDSVSKRLGLPGLRLGFARATGGLLSGIRASVGECSVGVSLAVAELGSHALERYCSESSIAESIQMELSRRREAVRNTMKPELLDSLVLVDNGIYGCLLFPSLDVESEVWRRARENDILLTPSSAMSSDPLRTPFLRFCVGATADLVKPFQYISEVMDEVRDLQPDPSL